MYLTTFFIVRMISHLALGLVLSWSSLNTSPSTWHHSGWSSFQQDSRVTTAVLRFENARPPSTVTQPSVLSVTLLLRCCPHARTHTQWKLTAWNRGNSIWWKTGTRLGGVRLIKWLWPFCYWNAFFNPADNIILGLYLCSWTYFKHSPLLSLHYILSSPFGIQFHYRRLISYILPFCHSVYCVAGILRLAVPTYPLTLLYNEDLMHKTSIGLCAALAKNKIFIYSWSKLIRLSKER